MENQEKNLEHVETNTYRCPECGAPMHYDPETSSLKCDYCLKTILLKEESSNEELDFDDLDKETDESWKNDVQMIRCQNCGAENIVSKHDMSTTCPFCGSTQVVKLDEVKGRKPNRVVPFKLGEKQAVVSYQKFIKSRFFAPFKVKKMKVEVKVSGTYIPSWTYDSDTFSSYEGRLGEHYTVTVGSGKNRHTEVRTRYFRISGTKGVVFDDVLVTSGKSISQTQITKLAPYSTNDSTEYNEGFLAGFSAEHYSLDVKDAWPTACSIMKEDIKRKILNGYHYDVVDYLKVNTTFDNTKYKYVLLPVWIGNFKYLKKNYYFVVNGETGKVVGNYPKSVVKITIAVLLAIALVVLLLYFFVFSNNGGGSDFDFDF